MRQIPAKIWIPVILGGVIAVVLVIYFTFPREEKGLKVFIPEKTPTEKEITPPEGIVWNVPEGQVDPEIKKEIRKSIYTNEDLISWGENVSKEDSLISFESIEIVKKCAVIGVAFREKQTNEFVPTAGVTLVLKKINGDWEKVGTFVYDFEIDYNKCEVKEGGQG